MDGSTAWPCQPRMSCGPGAVAASLAWSRALSLYGDHRRLVCVSLNELTKLYIFILYHFLSLAQVEHLAGRHVIQVVSLPDIFIALLKVQK